MEYNLQPATIAHFQTVLTWITTQDELRLWGGSALTFPVQGVLTWQEIGADDQNTFALLDFEGNVVGFGQALLRASNTVHLGRIIISPAMRGRGLGRKLCEQLIQAGIKRYNPIGFTLNVYRCNTTAVNLYRSLGFSVLSEDHELDSYKMGFLL